MVRKINRLSARQVETIARKGRYADGNGLWLQISDQQTKSWLFRFTLDGKQRQMGLGSVHTVSLSEARKHALECRKSLLDGNDPIDERKRQRQSLQAQTVSTKTFAWCARKYIAAHEAGWKNAKHAAQWSSTLETYAFSVIGKLSVSDIDTNLVVQVLEPIWNSKTETASRVRGRIEAILDWAKVRGFRDGENPARWKGHLDNVLPAKSKISEVKHHPALPYLEVGEFTQKLQQIDTVGAMALEFQILTAARPGEVREAEWDEIDIDKKEWSLAARRMKEKRPHVVPLSDPAIELLKALQQMKQSMYVFPGQRKNKPLSNSASASVIKRMGYKIEDVTPHGFRSTFKDWAMELTGYANEVSEMALSHKVADKVEAAYRRGDLRDKRRRLMEDWAAYCASGPLSAEVVPIRGETLL